MQHKESEVTDAHDNFVNNNDNKSSKRFTSNVESAQSNEVMHPYQIELQRIRSYFSQPHFPSTPHKIIDKDHTLLEVFKKSASFYKILAYLQSCGEAVERTKCSEWIDAQSTSLIPAVEYFTRTLFPRLHTLVDEIPLQDMTQQRFGNRAKRVFHSELEKHVHEWMIELARTFPVKPKRSHAQQEPPPPAPFSLSSSTEESSPPPPSSSSLHTHTTARMSEQKEHESNNEHESNENQEFDTCANDEYFYKFDTETENDAAINDEKKASAAIANKREESTDTSKSKTRNEEEIEQLATEMQAYLCDSFGNATRLDYGSGHELHFFILLMICLEEHGDNGGSLHDVPNILVPPPSLPNAPFTSSFASTNTNTTTNTITNTKAAIVKHSQPYGKDTTIHTNSNTCNKSAYIPHPVPADARSATRRLRQQFIFGVFAQYMTFVRRLQTHYSLEPAGSHGVWGLDDYHHIPYIFGAAQLIDAEVGKNTICTTSNNTTAGISINNNNNDNNNDNNNNKGNEIGQVKNCQDQTLVNDRNKTCNDSVIIRPADVCDKILVARYASEYMYFAMIQWIYNHKSGPFHEHSNMLYNISGVVHWSKVFGGMIKMYAAEVLAKFNVTQHLLFGKHLPWNTKQLNCSFALSK